MNDCMYRDFNVRASYRHRPVDHATDYLHTSSGTPLLYISTISNLQNVRGCLPRYGLRSAIQALLLVSNLTTWTGTHLSGTRSSLPSCFLPMIILGFLCMPNHLHRRPPDAMSISTRYLLTLDAMLLFSEGVHILC